MNEVFEAYLKKFVLVFFDDILVYSKSKAEHVQHLSLGLEVMQQHSLYAKMSKCSFAVPKVEYLGLVISREGVTTDPSKIQGMKD